MKKILITGSSGFIGSFLVEEALSRGYEVYAGMRASSKKTFLPDNRINFFEIDFSNSENLKKKLFTFKEEQGGFDFVIHNAGITKAKNPDDFITVNHQYTKNFVEALIGSNSIPDKFLYMSSLAAVGPGTGDKIISHETVPNPITKYGESKLSTEKYLNSLSGFPNIIIRPAAVYGPREKDFYVLYKVLKRGLEFYLGSREQRISVVYINDLSRAVLDALESSVINKSYFVSDGNGYTVQSLNSIIKKHLRKKTVSIVVPSSLVKPIAYSIEKISSLLGNDATFNRERVKEFEAANWLCDIEPIKKDLNYSPQYNLDTGMEESIRWYRENKWL